jgi:hypothetical protein
MVGRMAAALRRSSHTMLSITNSTTTLCPPKAEVTGSNPVGRAIKINDLVTPPDRA